jgi:hypothetical protein
MSAYTSNPTQGSGTGQACAYCHGFANIPTLIKGENGQIYLNPDAEAVKRFHLAAEPFGGTEGTLAPGETKIFTFTPPAEEESLGDMLVNELMALFDPNTTRNISVSFLNIQTDRVFQNAPIYNTLIFGDAFLNCCLPCCFLVQATNSVNMQVTNNDTVDVEVRIVARGKRFVPKDDEFRARMLMYWNQIPSYPYYLTLDEQEITVPAGATVTATMKVIGTGDFEVKWPRCDIQGVGGNPAPPYGSILLSVADGIGREWQSEPMPMDAFVATPTLVVSGFPGDLFRAAAACHCPPFSQLFKRNTIVRHTFTNTSANDALIRLTYAGCFHNVPECPPGRSMDRIRSLEPTIGPLLLPQRDYCPPQEEYYPEEPMPEPYPAPAPAPAAVAPAATPHQGMMFAAGPGGAMQVQAGGPLSYMSKYYAPGGGGMATATSAAHGYSTTSPMPGRQVGGAWPMGGMGQAPPAPPPGLGQRGQAIPPGWYYDTIAQTWRRIGGR